MDHIPQELLIYTIEFLSDDKQALKSCSLVSRRWAHPSRPLVFRSLDIEGANWGKDFREFTRFLTDNPDIGSFVHHLKLRSGCTSSSLDLSRIDALNLSVLLSMFTHLVSLDLINVIIERRRSKSPTILLSRNLHSLSFLRDCRADREAILDILGLFFKIDCLTLEDVRDFTPHNFDIDEETRRRGIYSRLQITSASFIGSFSAMTQFGLEVMRRMDTSLLASVAVSCDDIEELVSCGKLLSASCHTISRFSLDLEYLVSDLLKDDELNGDLWGNLHLSDCLSLKSVTLHGGLRSHWTVTNQATLEAFVFISSWLPPSVQEITFHLGLGGHQERLLDDLRDPYWGRLQVVLGPRSSLRRVTIDLDISEFPAGEVGSLQERKVEVVKRQLTELDERGILEIR